MPNKAQNPNVKIKLIFGFWALESMKLKLHLHLRLPERSERWKRAECSLILRKLDI